MKDSYFEESVKKYLEFKYLIGSQYVYLIKPLQLQLLKK